MIDATTKEPVDSLEVDAVMVCTGRAPFSNGLGLEKAGVQVCGGLWLSRRTRSIISLMRGCCG